MNSRLKKALLILLVVALLAAGGVVQGSMNRDRDALGLTRVEPLENAPPVLAFTTVALGGFRGLISNILWIRATKLQEEGKFFEMSQLAGWITRLQPHFTQVWIVQAWNMAYNISVKFKQNAPGVYSDRWRWVQRGIELLRDEGLRYNPNDPLMYRELAWFFQHKMGANLDDGHAYYKQAWAARMSRIFGGATNPVTPAQLANPQDDDTRARAALLREEYKMDPAFVATVEERHGPLEWRLPETHAIYWASVGLERARLHPERMNPERLMPLRRVIFQSMQMAFQRGRLLPTPVPNEFEYGPNLDIIPQVNAAYEQQMIEQPDKKDHIATGHRNFLRDACYFLFLHNREAEAARWFQVLAERYPDRPIIDGDTNSFPRNVTLDEFAFARLQEAVGETSEIGMRNALEGLTINAYMALLSGDAGRYAGFNRLAEIARARYQSLVTARHGAIDMPPLANIRRDVLARLLDPETGLPDKLAAELATALGAPLPPRATNAPPVAPGAAAAVPQS